MFTFAATPITFVALLVLFSWCTAWSVYELTRPQTTRQRLSNSLHLVMSAVMLAMVAGPTWTVLTSVIPTFGLDAVFAASTLWFCWLSVDAFRHAARPAGWHFAGHAAMFAAMTWHLAVMGVMESAMASANSGSGMGDMGGMGSMGGTEQWMDAASRPGGALWVAALIGLPLMVYLLVSSLRSLWLAVQPKGAVPVAAAGCDCGENCDCGPECACKAGSSVVEPGSAETSGASEGRAAVAVAVRAPAVHSCREVRPVGTAKYRLAALADFAMNFGMFWMSSGLMVALLPAFAMLAV